MIVGAPMGGVAMMAPMAVSTPAPAAADNEVKIDFDTNIFCGGPDIPYGRDNRLGEHIDHAGVSRGCSELVDAYNAAVGSRKYCLPVPFIAVVLMFTIIILHFTGVLGTYSAKKDSNEPSTTSCFPWWECGDGSFPSMQATELPDSGTEPADILVPVGAMLGGMIVLVATCCCWQLAEDQGIRAMRHKCGELNGTLSPINFRMDSRLETRVSTGRDEDGDRRVRVRTVQRWSLVISNTAMPAHAPAAVAVPMMMQPAAVMQPPTVVAPGPTPIHLVGENNPDFTNHEAGSKFCPSCGAPSAGMKFCGKCGKNLQGKDMGF